MANYWSDKFNALPMDIRTIACAVNNQARLRELKMERSRAVSVHKKHLKEIDDRIGYSERWQEKEFPTPELGE
jgi:hypothetical protein